MNSFRFLWLFCFLLAFELLASDPDVVWLGWSDHPENRIVIHWLQRDIVPLRISLREKGEESSHPLPLPSEPGKLIPPYVTYWIELHHLKPDTTYEFSFDKKKVYNFQTAPQEPHALRFIAGGDMFHSKNESPYYFPKMVKTAALQKPLFALFGGDLAYAEPHSIDSLNPIIKKWSSWFVAPKDSAIKRWIEWITTWGNLGKTLDNRLIPAVAILGNHDVPLGYYPESAPYGSPTFFALFPETKGKSYRVIDVGNYLSLFCLDSGHVAAVEGAQTEWLEKELRAREEVPFKIACYHIPAWPSVRSPSNRHSTSIREHWTPLFDRYGVAVAFENHDHAYKRTHPLRSGLPSVPGVLYLGDGAFGVMPRKVAKISHRPYLAKSASKRHFFLGVLRPERLNLYAIDIDGIVFDQAEVLSPSLLKEANVAVKGMKPADATAKPLTTVNAARPGAAP